MALHLVPYISETANGEWEELPGVTYVPDVGGFPIYNKVFRSTAPESFGEIWERYAEKSPRAWFMYEVKGALSKSKDGGLVRKNFQFMKFSALLGKTVTVTTWPDKAEEMIAWVFRVKDICLLCAVREGWQCVKFFSGASD